MIEVSNVCKKYGEDILFNNLSFKVNDGDFAVIEGESGSGKTTLLNMIGTLEEFDKGTIKVDGLNVRDKKNQRKLLSKTIGFVFQNFALVEDKTVKENLELVKRENRTDKTMVEALNEVGLDDKLDTKVYKLSGGEQQRIALARLLIKKCDLILCDEPTGSLDRKNADEVIKIIKNLNTMGKTILLVTHDEKYKSIGNKVIEI